MKMKINDKKLLLKDLCARLPYSVKIYIKGHDVPQVIEGILHLSPNVSFKTKNCYSVYLTDIKPYLRPMSSITKEEAKTFVILWGIKDFISLDITQEYIGVVCDDGFSSTATTEIWYDGDMPIECYDFLNAHHFDYRGLIPMDLALEAPENMYNFK